MGTFYDLALLCVLLVFVISGLRRGIVRSLIELAGFVVSLVVSVRLSGRFAAAAGPYLANLLPSFRPGQPLSRILAAAVLFAVMELLVHVIATSADHVFRLPVLRQVNMLLGGVFGLVKGVAILFVICALTRLTVPSGHGAASAWKGIENSKILQYMEEKNPVDTLLQADIWSGVDGDAGQKQKL
ncbi:MULTISPECIES: CvpA family protein [Acutalibacteraceae]|uniref:CvpA family protein n=1 Tax=Acutalibacteraceae TaxID=3082771 RepID=UPI0013E8ABC9|nr:MULTISPECIES: CvpA family protein [Acutalibacteraceae]